MYSFDSLSLKYFFEQNKDFILDSVVQKIQLPTRYEIILNLRNIRLAQNKKLYININPKYPHICFANDSSLLKRNIEIPKKPPMFCMLLRKYLNGSKIKDFKIVKYDRIAEFYFDYFDEIGSLSRICLCVEFMGKYSNAILYNAQNKLIIGSSHNVSSDKSSTRELYGGINYIYPSLKNKLDLLNVSYGVFYEITLEKDFAKISDNFHYLTQRLLESVFSKFESLKDVFQFLQELLVGQNAPFMAQFWDGGDDISNAIDNYFSNVIFLEIVKAKKAKLKRNLSGEFKKLQTNSNQELDLSKAQKYKTYGDIITANIYNIKEGQKEFIFEEYNIELDGSKNASENAQKYYSLYKKAKAAYEHALDRQKSAKLRLEYFETILFNIENCFEYEELDEIEAELVELNLIKGVETKKKAAALNKIEYRGYDIYIGKNNKQNDYLISHVAKSEDLWFHGLNFPSSHVILKVPNNKKEPPKDVLEFCAKLTKENSPAKNSGKTSIIMTKRKNLRHPPDTYLGYTTYKNEIEIVI